MQRNINTPVGAFAIPNFIAERLEKLSDIEVLQEYIDKCKNFIDPFLFNEMLHRKLIFAGEHNADVEKRLADMIAEQKGVVDEFEKSIVEYEPNNDYEDEYEDGYEP